jgi:hypothetical protein
MQKLAIVALFLLAVTGGNAQQKVVSPSNTFNNTLGINAFEWDFLQDPKNPNDASKIYEPNMEIIKSFGGFRHYLDWQKVEPKRGSFTFNPTNNGGWNLDVIYQRCKQEGIDVLVCLKGCPDWLLDTYPVNLRDGEDIPMAFGAKRDDPSSYIEQAKMAFQFAARYGNNKNVNPALVTVDSKPRWTADPVNVPKTGLGYIKYIECDNERDKWWKGDKAHQTAEEYAANLSAFYDGDKGRLGKNAGVKNADPNIKVVMAGLAKPDPDYVRAMINWCRVHRGYKADGSVNLCFDVINYHYYSNNAKPGSMEMGTEGVAPELSQTAQLAEAFVKLGKQYHLPVWVTESGYDVNQGSPQKVIPVGNKSAMVTQADWIIRTSLLYARHGVNKVFYYELFDDNSANPIQYASSGLANKSPLQRRPAANYIYQVKHLLGGFTYKGTINNFPLVDVYRNGNKTIYVLTIPDEHGKTGICTLNMGSAAAGTLYQLNPDGVNMTQRMVSPTHHNVKIKVSETPVFVEKVD